MPASTVKHRSALSPKDLPAFFRQLEVYQGELTKRGIELILLTFVRTNELRFAQWSELEGLNGQSPLWRIPAERMKKGRAHLVP